ncbi:MAG: hypothetical protein IT582_01590 [Opitutaceae bacterium]|nr:hypothetical protein [Opitutaceae bacterium]
MNIEDDNPPTARFTLQPGQWYAAVITGDEFATEPDLGDYSPIRVDRIETQNTGRRCFQLHFYHANYPEGVRHKLYSLQTLERGAHYLLARSTDHSTPRLLLIYAISWRWLQAHFRVVPPGGDRDIQRWLATHA